MRSIIKIFHSYGVNTSSTEIKDLFKGWLAVSFAFSIVLGGTITSANFIPAFIISLIVVGTGFIFHELAHKAVAQHYGCFAEFRSFDKMLILAIIVAFLGFIFAAPGAVMIHGVINARKNGIISLAGPLTNIVLAVVFYIISILYPFTFIGTVGGYGFMINTWLAIFNLLPFAFFDGAKVFYWTKIA